jgi:hypothetical protein
MEWTTPPGAFTPLLSESGVFSDVIVMPELDGDAQSPPADAAVLLECVDRSPDPSMLLQRVSRGLKKEGLLFLTALVSSGFDITVLGLENLYIYPPDRTNCFSIAGLIKLLRSNGFAPVEVSTPGVLDVEIVEAHRKHNANIVLSPFERQLLSGDAERKQAVQVFLQENLMSSFARIVARRI